MKLLGTQTSPYVRKARLVLLEKNIPHSYIIDPPILMPRNNALERMCVKRWEAMTDGIMDSAVMVRKAESRNLGHDP